MSRFYASIEGQAKTSVTRQGSAKSGISGHIRGWHVGIKIYGRADNNDNDCFDVELTSGSTGAKRSKHIGTFTKKDLED